MPFGSLDELTPVELSWLIDSNDKKQREEYESLYNIFRLAYVSAQTGKDIPLFEEKKETNNTITIEEREADLSFLKTTFKEG